MSLIKTYLHKKMSDFHETALLKYEEEQDQLHREDLEREQNPTKYWLITTSDWHEYANTEEEKQEFIDLAKKDNLKFSCSEHIQGETY